MSISRKTVLIVGGGYAGIELAHQLDAEFDVTLLERKKNFFSQIASPRALVQQGWEERVYVPYDKLLKRGKVLYGEAKEITPDYVLLDTGDKLSFDYLLLALGSTTRFPTSSPKDVEQGKRLLRATWKKVNEAERITIIGGGPVGVEIAGEIATDYPNKKVTLIQSHNHLLEGTWWTDKFRDRVLRVLRNDLHVEVILGEKAVVTDKLSSKNGTEEENITVASGEGGPAVITLPVSGRTIETDLYYLATGIKPNNDPLKAHFADKLNERGHIRVNQFLQVEGYTNIFAVGDINDAPVPKQALSVHAQVGVAVSNVKALSKNPTTPSLTPLKPLGKISPVLVSIGRNKGVGLLPNGWVLGDWPSRMLKTKDLLTGKLWKTLGYKSAPSLEQKPVSSSSSVTSSGLVRSPAAIVAVLSVLVTIVALLY